MQKDKIETEIADILQEYAEFDPKGMLIVTKGAVPMLAVRERKAGFKGVLAGMMLGVLLSICVIGTLWLNDQPAVIPTMQDVDSACGDTLTFSHNSKRNVTPATRDVDSVSYDTMISNHGRDTMIYVSHPKWRSLMPNTLTKTRIPQ